MEAYLNEAPCLFFSSTADGRIVDVNETLCHSLGYSKEELTGQKLETIFSLSTRIFQQTHLFPLLKMQGFADEIYITLLARDQAMVPVLVNAKKQVVEGEEVFSHVGITVHNRKKFEDELIAARNAAERALTDNTALLQAKEELQKQTRLLDQQISLATKQNEELRQFSRIITHDVQEPLRKLFVFTDMLLQNKNSDENTRIIHKLQSFTQQMRAIVSGLQQYIWLTEIPPNHTDINLPELVIETKKAVEETAGVSICLVTDNLPLIRGDREQLRFLFSELLTNAVRFRRTPDKVRLQFHADVVTQNSFRSVAGKYDYIAFNRLQLMDDGFGFDPAYKEKVFLLFKRLHSKSGRGVGLALCKKIMEIHGGSMAIDSMPGEGTTVSLLLPVNGDV